MLEESLFDAGREIERKGKLIMKVKRLALYDFRGIEKLELDLTEPVTCFVGVNGAGKSAVLDALAIALSQLTARISGQPHKARPIALDDIRHEASFARIEITVELRGAVVTWAIVTNRKKGSYNDSRRKSSLEALNHAVTQLTQEWEHVESERQEPYSLPLAVYYDVNRAVLDIPVRVRESLTNNPNEVYRDALDHGGADFKRFFIWFRNREDYENEQRRDSPNYRDPALEAVRQAITTFTGFREPRIRRRPSRMTVIKGALEFNVAQLSDGERNMLAMVGDLARRFSVLNTGLTNPHEGKGVALIDEIDLHLHPRWQRDVVANLQTTFPNCQFILTTHSPQVIGELPPESVMLLSEGGLLGHAEHALGLSSGEVLEQLMEVSALNHPVQGEIERIQTLLDADKTNQAREQLSRLRSKVGTIPAVLELEAAIQSLKWLEDSD